MAALSQKKRKVQEGIRGKTERPKKRFRKQKDYHSSSEESDGVEEGFTAVNLNDTDDEADDKPRREKRQKTTKARPVQITPPDVEAEDEQNSGSEGDSDVAEEVEDDDRAGVAVRRPTTKRNDPEAFSTSIAKILSTKLSQAARKDPLLSRSREAVEASTSLANERLEKKAKAKIRAEKKEELDRGRIKDVLGLNSGQAGEIAEEEKRLRKVAQRGVVKLFNAVRAAQVKGEQAAKEERKKGTIGMENRQEKVNEMSKQGFLDLIGGKKASTAVVH